MINYDSIISVFNEKGTLLKWLKKVEKALKESVLTNVEVLQGQGNSFAFKFTFQDNTSITTDYVTIEPNITVTLLQNYIEGSDTIVVDLNELQNKLIVKLDEEYKKTLATKTDIENLESELTTKQNTIVDSEEIVKHTGENNKLYLNNNITTKINNSIQLPETAPTATELVGIGTNKAQVNVSIGDGLSLENGTLKATGGGASYFSYFGLNGTINGAFLRIIKQTEAVSAIYGIKPNFQREAISTTIGTIDLNDGYIGIEINAQSTNTLTITTNAKLLCYRFGPGNDVEKIEIKPNTPVVFDGRAGGSINLTLYCLETTGNDSITINFVSD